MNTQQEKEIMKDMQKVFQKMYRFQLSENVKRAIRAKKERSLHVKKSKV
jgi:uncharacterized protein with gpF-like domain